MYRAHGRILFASAHCLTDFSSGAAIATLDALGLLTRMNLQCRAFCASKLDAGSWEAGNGESGIGHRGLLEFRKQKLMIGSQRSVELTHCAVGEVPIQIVQTESSRIDQWSPGEAETMLAAFERVVDDFRPDVLLTYGGDPVTREMMRRVNRQLAVGSRE